MPELSLVAIVVIIGLLGFWIAQFVHLMSRSDDDFPGRFDKPIWALLLITTNVLGAFIYWYARPQPTPVSSDALRRQFELAQRKQL